MSKYPPTMQALDIGFLWQLELVVSFSCSRDLRRTHNAVPVRSLGLQSPLTFTGSPHIARLRRKTSPNKLVGCQARQLSLPTFTTDGPDYGIQYPAIPRGYLEEVVRGVKVRQPNLARLCWSALVSPAPTGWFSQIPQTGTLHLATLFSPI